MIITQLQTMQTLLIARAQSRDETKILARLVDYELKLKSSVYTYEDRIQLAQRLNPDFSSSEIARNIRNTLKGVGNRFAQTQMLTDQDIADLKDKLRILVEDLKIRWQTKKLQLVDDELLSQIDIARKIGTSHTQSQLKSIYDKLIKMQQQQDLPRVADYDQFVADIAEAKQVVARSLPAMTPNIQAFLEALTSKRARLKDVTPEVFEWCRKQHLLEWISLSLGV